MYESAGTKDKSKPRETKHPVIIRLSQKRTKELDTLVDGWDIDDKSFVRGKLVAYLNVKYPGRKQKRFNPKRRKHTKQAFPLLSKLKQLNDAKERFRMIGEHNVQKTFDLAFERELNFYDMVYLLDSLNRELSDIYVPPDFLKLIKNTFGAHITRDIPADRSVPKRPMILVTGASGAGKTRTISEAIERAIFESEVIIVGDYGEEKSEILKKLSLFSRIFFPDKKLKRLKRKRRVIKQYQFYTALLNKVLLRRFARYRLRKISREIEKLNLGRDLTSYTVSYTNIGSADVHTPLAGGQGTLFRKEVGKPERLAIQHIVEAHTVFEKPNRSSQLATQETNLATATLEYLDEIGNGIRYCLMIADTNSPQLFNRDAYRRIVEKGLIINANEWWEKEENVVEVIRKELKLQGVSNCGEKFLRAITQKIIMVFGDKNLPVTPAYFRKLISSMIAAKGDLKPEYFDDEQLIRLCFKAVSSNYYGEMEEKILRKIIDPKYDWDNYRGEIKHEVAEMLNNRLLYNSEDKGVVLEGTFGSGKSFLCLVLSKTFPEFSSFYVNPGQLSDRDDPVDGPLKKLDEVIAIARLHAPSFVVFQEPEATFPKREAGSRSYDEKMTNKFLDILDGVDSVHGIFFILCTNLFKKLDPGLIREKRLKLKTVDGKLSEKDILKIIAKHMADVPRTDEVSNEEIYRVVKNLSSVPAGYANFPEIMCGFRKSELNTIYTFKEFYEKNKSCGGCDTELSKFIKHNANAMMRIMTTVGVDEEIILKARKDRGAILENKAEIYKKVENICCDEDYKLKRSHLDCAREDFLKDPRQKSLQSLDRFLTGELSQENQVGTINGAAFGPGGGVILPIRSKLVFKDSAENIIITGAAEGPSLSTEVNARDMTLQSAKQAMSWNTTYLQILCSESKDMKNLDADMIIGYLLENKAIHHDFESVHYQLGGPSAGAALAINTLSVLFEIPVFCDFGITGAPSIRGVRKGKAGSLVIIGGEDQKTAKLLMELRRMYVPYGNYAGIPYEQHQIYWAEGKGVFPVKDYRDVIGEVLCFNEEHEKLVDKLFNLRIRRNIKLICHDERELKEESDSICRLEEKIRLIAECEILQRLKVVHTSLSEEKRGQCVRLDFMQSLK